MPGLFDLAGKAAVVTGSSRGIGRAIAERLAEHGARVVVSSRHPEACEAVAAAIRARGGEAAAIGCDVADEGSRRALLDGARARFGGVDVLVCNAAANPYFGSMAGIPDAAYDRIMDVNLRSTLRLCNGAAPGMAEAGGGAIVVVSSIAGLRGSTSIGMYGVSKAATMQLVRNLACEWGPRGVRANCIAPGLVRTDFARALWEDPDALRRRLQDTPLGRIGEPDDIAGAAVFLASAAGSFVTGQTIVVDGGVTVGAPALPSTPPGTPH